MTKEAWVLIATLILVYIGGTLIRAHNKYAEYESTCDMLYKNLEALQKSRYDMLKQLLSGLIVFGDVEYELKILKSHIDSYKVDSNNITGVNENDTILTYVSSKLEFLSDTYSQLNYNKLLLKYLEGTLTYTDAVYQLKVNYNIAATRFNFYKTSFPDLILLQLLGKDVKKTDLCKLSEGEIRY